MQKIGKLKIHTSAEIEQSCVSIGFECLDRELFDAGKCYDKNLPCQERAAQMKRGRFPQNEFGFYFRKAIYKGVRL